jgi:uncharacterized phage protein gp47/JayE
MTFEQIPKVVLDPNNDEELTQLALSRTYSASEGKLSDFSESSPLFWLVRAQVFCIAELLWYLNKLPEALALEVLRLSGVQRSAGTKATGKIVFLLQSPLLTDFIVNPGYFIPLRSTASTATGQTAGYLTTDQLVIPAGGLYGSVAIEAIEVGTAYNQAAFSLTTASVGLAYVQSLYNDEPLTGGTDLEPLEVTLARAQTALRSRGVLVSALDFEESAESLLGAGSRATCIPLLSSDRETYQVGQVHVFLVGADGMPPSTGTCQSIKSELQQQSFAASSVWVSPVSMEPVTVSVIANVEQISLEIAKDLETAIADYLSPQSFILGSTIKVKEIEYLSRSVFGVTEIQSVLLDNQAVNRPMPLLYSQPFLETLEVTLIQSGASETFYLGTGDGDTD